MGQAPALNGLGLTVGGFDWDLGIPVSKRLLDDGLATLRELNADHVWLLRSYSSNLDLTSAHEVVPVKSTNICLRNSWGFRG